MVVSILNYIDYKKDKVMDVLQNELGWVYYGGKHYESIYTRFYQGYILPEKFNIDKRRGHLSDLIHSGQLSREQALEDIKAEKYPQHLFNDDLIFVKKKLGLSDNDFNKIMETPVRKYTDYPNIESRIMKIKKVLNYFRRKGLYSK
jgi:hypothetical protein